MKWEYTTILAMDAADGAGLEQTVAEHGRKGWEMFTATHHPAGTTVLWFKRPLKDPV